MMVVSLTISLVVVPVNGPCWSSPCCLYQHLSSLYLYHAVLVPSTTTWLAPTALIPRRQLKTSSASRRTHDVSSGAKGPRDGDTRSAGIDGAEAQVSGPGPVDHVETVPEL